MVQTLWFERLEPGAISRVMLKNVQLLKVGCRAAEALRASPGSSESYLRMNHFRTSSRLKPRLIILTSSGLGEDKCRKETTVEMRRFEHR